MREAEVRIERMAYGGAGIGHLSGKVCFVPFTAPGDLARIGVKVDKRSYLEGELLELIEPAEGRVTPPCPVFGVCGGCQWQHLPYGTQLTAKEDIFRETLWRTARVERDLIEGIVAAPEPFGYRSRVQLKVRFIGGELHLGFYRGGSHFVVDVPGGCAIADPVINRLIPGIGRALASSPDREKIPQVDLAVGDDGRVELVVHHIGDERREVAGHFKEFGRSVEAAGVFLQSGRKTTIETPMGESEQLGYTLPERLSPHGSTCRLNFANGGFSQVNIPQNLVLVETVLQWAGLGGGETVLDLFCGNGNLSIPLSARAGRIIGVEEYTPSIDCARRNCEQNGIENVSFRCGDAVSTVRELMGNGASIDLVILDPPRSGAREIAAVLPSLAPERILYVSCDPPTLARDLAQLKKGGYRVVRSRPVDMFPQTYHTESVTLLER